MARLEHPPPKRVYATLPYLSFKLHLKLLCAEITGGGPYIYDKMEKMDKEIVKLHTNSPIVARKYPN